MIYNILQCLAVILILALTFRIRGGLRIPKINKKFPLNKYWFAVTFACCAAWLTGNWTLQYWLIVMIATRLSTQCAGWGEAVGIVLRWAGPLDPDRRDLPQVDDVLENFEIQERNIKIGKFVILHIPHYKLLDHPRTFAISFLVARGFLISFLIGLAIQSISFLPVGIMMPLWYYLAGFYNRKVKPLEKCGWNVAEYLFGGYLGLMLYVCIKIIGF